MKRFLVFSMLLLVWINIYPYNRISRALTLADGLSDLIVIEIYKDSLGYVWIGTGKAIDRYDGIHLKRYDIPGTNEQLKRVNAITELPGNELWMGNGMGLWRLNRKKDKLEMVADETITGAVYSLLYDGKDKMYIGTNRGLYIYRSGMIEQVLVDSNPFAKANTIYAMNLYSDSMLWLGTEEGLYGMSIENHEFVSYRNMESNGHFCRFTDMARIGTILYLATNEHGIISFDMQTKEFRHYVDVGCNVISSLSCDGEKMLYVGTDGNGIHFIDTSSDTIVQTVRYEGAELEGLRSNSVYSLLVDKEGLVWVGYYQQGLNYTLYQNNLFTTYTYSSLLDTKGMPIRAISIRDNEMLIGSRNGLFYVDENKHRYKDFYTPHLRSNMVFSILYYQGEYYIGTYGGGMYVLNPQSLELRDFDPDCVTPFVNGQIFCIKEDAENRMWIGTSNGLYCYQGSQLLAHYNSSNSSLPSGNVYEIYFDSTHKGWICTENGLCIWDPSTKTLRTDIFPDGFIHRKKIRVIYEDSKHQLYFCPDQGALFQSDLSMTKFHSLQSGSLLDDRNGMFVIEDWDGWLWIGTNNGLFRYDKKENFIPYHFKDGVSNSNFTLCPPVMDERGNLWLANSDGLLYLEKARMKREEKHPYPLRITDVKYNSTTSVTFYFSDFSYTSHTSMMYEYQLNEDEGWTPLYTSSSVTYYDLKPGNHIFKVRRLGEPESETQVVVKIKSAIGYRWMAVGIMALIMIMIVWMIWSKKRVVSDDQTFIEKDALPMAELEKYKTNRISQEECKRLSDALEKYMLKEKPYVNPNLKLGDLASVLGTSSHTLSYLFSQYMNCSYYDYVTNYRIVEFKRLVKTGEYDKYTLTALSELCGFNSRASFFRSFKKVTGVTPSEYISQKE